MTRQTDLDFRDDTNLNNLAELISKLYADRDLIASALMYSGGTHTFDDVAAMVISGRALYWHLDDSFVIAEKVTYPKLTVLNVFLAGGDLEEITAIQPELIKAGKALGCSALSLAGRSGWLKVLESQGWKPHLSSCYLDFNDFVDKPDDVEDKETKNGRVQERQRHDRNESSAA